MPISVAKSQEPTIAMGSVGEWEMFGLILPPGLKITPSTGRDETIVLKASTAMKLLDHIFEDWRIPHEVRPQLLGVATDEYTCYLHSGYPRSPGVLQRLEDLHAVYRALSILFPDPDIQRHWFVSPNTYFNGLSPSEVVRQSGAAAVRRYLEGYLQ